MIDSPAQQFRRGVGQWQHAQRVFLRDSPPCREDLEVAMAIVGNTQSGSGKPGFVSGGEVRMDALQGPHEGGAVHAAECIGDVSAEENLVLYGPFG